MLTTELSPEAVRAVTCERLKLLSYGLTALGVFTIITLSQADTQREYPA